MPEMMKNRMVNKRETNKIEETKIDSASLIHFSCTILSYPIPQNRNFIDRTEGTI